MQLDVLWGGGAVNPHKGVWEQSSKKLDIHSSLTSRKDNHLAGQTKLKMLSFSYCDRKNKMPPQLGCHSFIIYRTVQK